MEFFAKIRACRLQYEIMHCCNALGNSSYAKVPFVLFSERNCSLKICSLRSRYKFSIIPRFLLRRLPENIQRTLSIEVFMKIISSHENSIQKIPTSYYTIHEIQEDNFDLPDRILFAHAVSVCDATSAIHRKGKEIGYKIIKIRITS